MTHLLRQVGDKRDLPDVEVQDSRRCSSQCEFETARSRLSACRRLANRIRRSSSGTFAIR